MINVFFAHCMLKCCIWFQTIILLKRLFEAVNILHMTYNNEVSSQFYPPTMRYHYISKQENLQGCCFTQVAVNLSVDGESLLSFFFQMMIYRNHWFSIYYLIGNGKDYMNLALKDGTIALTVALGTGKLDTAIDPDNVRFDDNVWHHVLVQRHASDVSIVDIFLISS